MTRRRILLLSFLAIIFMICIPVTAEADWVKEEGNYYYYNNKGKKLKKQWIGNYYVDGNGIRATNTWVKNKFVGNDGKVIPNFRGGWIRIKGKWYFYTKAGVKKTGWLQHKGKSYYLNKNGVMQTEWQNIDNERYYFHKTTGQMQKGWKKAGRKTYYFKKKTGQMTTGWQSIKKKKYYFNKKGVMQTGKIKIGGHTYYFASAGHMLKGWRTINKKTYYFKKDTGIMFTGLKKISGVTYYFKNSGVMQKNTTVNVNGVTYSIDGYGRCTIYTPPANVAITDKMLFFTQFESGSSGYAQTGGDNGCACGMYQFDYRYALLPFVKYCYAADPVLFKEFKTYANYSLTTVNKAKLKGNAKFFTAWKTIYNRSPEGFARYQDNYAKMEYYDVSANYMFVNYGINMTGRSDVVKGAVFSYSIQHGAQTAAKAVKAAKITNATSDLDFLIKLYDYRWSSSSGWAKRAIYKSRYQAERALAISLL